MSSRESLVERAVGKANRWGGVGDEIAIDTKHGPVTNAQRIRMKKRGGGDEIAIDINRDQNTVPLSNAQCIRVTTIDSDS